MFCVYWESFWLLVYFLFLVVLFMIFVICVKIDEEVEEFVLSQDLWFFCVGKGLDSRVLSIEEVKVYYYIELDKN